MQPSEIVNQLKGVLGRQTDIFCDVKDVTSLTRSGNVVTATTSAAHNLNVGAEILITDAKTPISVNSLTRINSTAIALTDGQHNLTFNDKTVEIVGANETEYNGIKERVEPTKFQIDTITISGSIATVTTKEDNGFIADSRFEVIISGAKQSPYNKKTSILSIIDSKTFTYNVIGTESDASAAFGKTLQVQQHLNSFSFTFEVDGGAATPATGAIYQVKQFQQGYNGLKIITSTPSSNSFTYNISSTPLSPAQGSIKAKSDFTITAAIDFDSAVQYFNTSNNIPWLMVIMGDEVLSRDIRTENDASAQQNAAYAFKELNIQSLNIYVFLPNSETLKVNSVSLARSLKKSLYKAIVGVKFNSELSTNYTSLVPKINGVELNNDAYYVHNYEFEATNYIYKEDIVDPADGGVFREFDFDNLDNDENVTLKIKGRVDN